VNTKARRTEPSTARFHGEWFVVRQDGKEVESYTYRENAQNASEYMSNSEKEKGKFHVEYHPAGKMGGELGEL